MRLLRADQWAFAARVALVFVALSVLPIPWLAGGYTAGFARLANGVLTLADGSFRVAARFEPLPAIARDAPWKVPVTFVDRRSGRAHVSSFDVKSLSFRPVAMFLAVAAASIRGAVRRRAAFAWAAGALLLVGVMLVLSALPLFARFAEAGSLGPVAGAAVRTAYQALATPVVVIGLGAGVAAWARAAAARGRARPVLARGEMPLT